MASADAFETTLRATASAWTHGELGRRQAVELMARAIELHMNQLSVAPTKDDAGSPGAAVYIHIPREPLNPEERAFEQLYDEARAFWASGRGIRRSGK
jgi:hypothetical protein